MNKEQYIAKLKELLISLPEEEIESAVAYVEEYFFEATEENFEQAMEDLGSPQRFAAQIKAEHTIKRSEEIKSKPYSRVTSKEDIRKKDTSIWTIIFGILSLPISLPLLFVVVALIMTGVIAVATPIIVLVTLVIVFIGVIIAMIQLGIKVAAVSISSGLLMLAGVLMLIALVCLTVAVLLALIKKLIPWLIKKLGNLYKKLKGDVENE